MTRVVFAIALAVGVHVHGIEQSAPRPDYSGQWKLGRGLENGVGGAGASGRGAVGRDGGGAKPICGDKFSIVQDAKTLTIARTIGEKPVKIAITLG